MQLRMKLVALGVAGGTAALVLAGIPAQASSHAARTRTGPEVIAGSVHGKKALANAPLVPLTLRGLVRTHGIVNLGGPNSVKKHAIRTPAGTLWVKLDKRQTSQTANRRTCRVSYTEDDTFQVLGSKSTGAFAGSSGPGAVRLHFGFTLPRYRSGPHKGKCNGSNNARPLTRGAIGTFLASIVLTVR